MGHCLEPSTAAKELAGEIVCAWQADKRGTDNLVERIARALTAKDAALAEAKEWGESLELAVRMGREKAVQLEAALAEAEQERDVLRITCDAHITVIDDLKTDLAAMRVCDICHGKGYWISKEGAEIGCDCLIREERALKEFAPTRECVNALPEGIRQYVHNLETRCDPAGDLQRIAFLQESVAALTAERGTLRGKITALEAKLAVAECERDALRDLRDEAIAESSEWAREVERLRATAQVTTVDHTPPAGWHSWADKCAALEADFAAMRGVLEQVLCCEDELEVERIARAAFAASPGAAWLATAREVAEALEAFAHAPEVDGAFVVMGADVNRARALLARPEIQWMRR